MYSDDNIITRIKLITHGVPLHLENISFRINESGRLSVTGWTSTVHFENILKENVLHELENLKYKFLELTAKFPELNDVVETSNLMVEYSMAYDDDGKVGIELCSEMQGSLSWYIE